MVQRQDGWSPRALLWRRTRVLTTARHRRQVYGGACSDAWLFMATCVSVSDTIDLARGPGVLQTITIA